MVCRKSKQYVQHAYMYENKTTGNCQIDSNKHLFTAISQYARTIINAYLPMLSFVWNYHVWSTCK